MGLLSLLKRTLSGSGSRTAQKRESRCPLAGGDRTGLLVRWPSAKAANPPSSALPSAEEQLRKQKLNSEPNQQSLNQCRAGQQQRQQQSPCLAHGGRLRQSQRQ